MNGQRLEVVDKFAYLGSALSIAMLNDDEVTVVSVSCFGVWFLVMFHFMFVHYTFSSVWVAGWPPFGK